MTAQPCQYQNVIR